MCFCLFATLAEILLSIYLLANIIKNAGAEKVIFEKKIVSSKAKIYKFVIIIRLFFWRIPFLFSTRLNSCQNFKQFMSILVQQIEICFLYWVTSCIPLRRANKFLYFHPILDLIKFRTSISLLGFLNFPNIISLSA